MKNYIPTLALLLSSAWSFGQFEYLATDSLRYIMPIDTAPPIVIPPSTSTPDTGLKLSFWIHGIAGNNTSWGRVASVTAVQSLSTIPGYPERNTISFVLDYSHLEGTHNLDAIGADMAQWMQNNLGSLDSLEESNNIAIAHSQGGLVGRAIRYMTETDYRYNESYGALATFGSPHQGANLVNATVSNGPAEQWLTDGCEALVNAEIQTFVNTNWALDALIHPSKISSFTNEACNGLGNTVIPKLLHIIRKPTAQDYGIGAQPLAKLDSFARIDSMPVVTFYGVEEDPLIWRVAQSLSKTTDTVPSGSILYADPFGLNADGALATFVNQKISSYDTKKASERSKARMYRNLEYIKPLLPILRIFRERAEEKADIYENAENWLANANPTWKRLIGVRKDSTYTSSYLCECHLGYGQMHMSVVSDPLECPPPGLQSFSSHSCIITPMISHMVVDEPSDGIVPVSSQRGYPGWKTGEARMVNTNHMQERNCTETRDRLNELFDGLYGDQFSIDKR